MKFEIKDRDASGRICKLITKNGTVNTPNLLPVINPNKMIIPPNEMKKLFGVEAVITNSYIINKDEKLREKALDKGVHKLLNFDNTIMTDSGTFQSYVYKNIDIDPIEIVKFQRDIDSDIGTILDVFSTPDQKKSEVENGIKVTLNRAKKSLKVKKDMILACTVQGSIYPELREKCARELSKTEADFFPIGGVVPLMENQRYTDLVRCIISSKKGLNPSKPVHLFGAGHPLIFPLAVALGCDLFDSSAYIKYANDGRMIFYWGTEKLQDLSELPCNCPICSKYSATELKKLDKKFKTLELAKHNLYVSFSEIKKIKNAIVNGNLWELVERRANSNPYLIEALRELRKKENKKFLEINEPISKNKALFYTGNHTIHRPIIYRYHKRLLNRYKIDNKDTVLFPDIGKPYSIFLKNELKKIFENTNANILIDSHLGPVPIELDEMYPIAQSVFPKITDKETEEFVTGFFEEYVKDFNLICWKGNQTFKELKKVEKKENIFDKNKIFAVSEMQFGKGIAKILLKGDINLVKSKRTGKIRNIYCNGKHILSMRASDGLFTLKLGGARKIISKIKLPKLRVIVKKDAVSFIKEGKSVFSKFVKDCDIDLRPFDECIVVDEKDNLLAVGRCILNKNEMLSFNYGMAVKIREHI